MNSLDCYKILIRGCVPTCLVIEKRRDPWRLIALPNNFKVDEMDPWVRCKIYGFGPQHAVGNFRVFWLVVNWVTLQVPISRSEVKTRPIHVSGEDLQRHRQIANTAESEIGSRRN